MAAKPKARPGAERPNMVCPFSGASVEIEFNERISMYRIVTDLYVTKWYKDKLALQYDFSVRDGVKPAFPREIRVEVREREAPLGGNPTHGFGTGELDMDKVERIVGGLKPK